MTKRDLARLFSDFNSRYFGGRLPRYRVCFREVIAGLTNEHFGRHNRNRRTIFLFSGIRYDKHVVAEMLLHEMIHAATGDYHGGRFWRECKRLLDAGAPLRPTWTGRERVLRYTSPEVTRRRMRAKPGKGGRGPR